jgi:predicted nucleic acid-binding protein
LILVDANVLLDVLFRNEHWHIWSLAALERARADRTVLINDVIYAETCTGYTSPDDLNADLSELGIERRTLSDKALFAASRAFVTYRRRGGTRTGVLPDFFIGAQAQTERWTILTRDTQRYRAYFPDVALIAPDGA